jgi:hypothetical protein
VTAVARRDRARVRVVVALVAGLACAAAADARAATQQVAAAGDAGAAIAVGADGRAFLVTPGARRAPAGPARVRARSAAPGARFGAPRTVLRSRRGERAAGAGVAADGRGVIVVQRIRGTRRRVRAIAFGARGRLTRAATISRGGASDFAALDVAPTGAAVVVWFRHTRSGRWRLEAAIREPEANAFGPPQPVSAFVRRPCCTAVAAAIGERGDAVVAWRSTSRPAVRAALRRPGRAFAPPQRLAGDAADEPRAVVGADGTAAVLYSVQHVPLRAGDGLHIHRAPGGAPFAPAERINPGGGVTAGEATVTPAGRVVVAWVDTATASVRLAEAGAGQALSGGAALGTGVPARGLAVAADDAGRAVVAWTGRVPARPTPRQRAMAAMRPVHGAPFGPAVALGRPWRATEPEIARLLPDGGALVAWTGSRFGPPRARRTALAVTRLP